MKERGGNGKNASKEHKAQDQTGKTRLQKDKFEVLLLGSTSKKEEI